MGQVSASRALHLYVTGEGALPELRDPQRCVAEHVDQIAIARVLAHELLVNALDHLLVFRSFFEFDVEMQPRIPRI